MNEPIQQRVVTFYGDQLIAMQQSDGTIFVHFTRLCENLGLNRASAGRRIHRHEVLQEGMITLQVATEGGVQTVQCLRVDLLPLWLSTLQASRVKEDVRPKLVRYQKEAAVVLWQAFRPQIVIEEPTAGSATNASLIQLQQIAEMGRAITHMAEQQMELQRRQQALTGRMDTAARVIRGFQAHLEEVDSQLLTVDVRLGVLEDRLKPGATIMEEQATEISNRVKALAELMTAIDASKNHYQGIFAELYRRFGVSSYKLIPQTKYPAVLAFLDDWREASHRTVHENDAS
ncbi:MAG: ORF6C domain-containing protein [Actinomycetota bacterium]|nr:ORF6C domain-containing protein [Actinomycetota bacterium]